MAAGLFKGYPSGNALFPTIANQPTSENYILGRMDYTLGSKDSLFGRYISDTAYLLLPDPFSNLSNWPAAFHGGDQFFTVEEKHIVTATSINEIRFSFSRTNERSDQKFLSDPATDPLQFYLGALFNGSPAYNPGDREDGNLIVAGGTSNVGPGPTARWHLIQNKFTGGDDFFWSHGAHSLKIGGSVSRVQNNIAVGREGGIFVFGSLPGFLAATPVQFQGEVNPHPGFTRTRYSREIQFFPYIQDDWKIRSNLTLNIGLRYDFESNPVCVTEPCNAILNPLSSPAFTQVHHVLRVKPGHVELRSPSRSGLGPFLGSQDVGTRRVWNVPRANCRAHVPERILSESRRPKPWSLPGLPRLHSSRIRHHVDLRVRRASIRRSARSMDSTIGRILPRMKCSTT